MSKAKPILPGKPLFEAQQLKRGVFRKPTPDTSLAFNGTNDPLTYRASLTAPLAATPGTGFAVLDTSIVIIRGTEKGISYPIGFKFNSHGIEFKIEKSSTAGAKPIYQLSVITSDKLNAPKTSYRMSREDAAFTLACLQQEVDRNDKTLVALMTLFEKEKPTISALKSPLDITSPFQNAYKLEFANNDRKYTVNVSDSSKPRFRVTGTGPDTKTTERDMTATEIKFATDKIAAEMPRDKAVFYAPYIQKMREFYWDLTTLPVSAGKAASSRSIDFFG